MVYTESLQSTHPKTHAISSTPLNIQSKVMDVHLQTGNQQSSQLMIDQITADDQVSISYKDFWQKPTMEFLNAKSPQKRSKAIKIK